MQLALGAIPIAVQWGLVNGMAGLVALVILVNVYDNCFYKCEDYFHTLSSNNQQLEVYSPFSDAGHIIVTDKSPDSVKIYMPSYSERNEKQYLVNIDTENCPSLPIDSQISITENKDTNKLSIDTKNPCLNIKPDLEEKTLVFKRSKRKAKLVKFSDFRKTDPVLAKYTILEPEYVPQEQCKLTQAKEKLNEQNVNIKNKFNEN